MDIGTLTGQIQIEDQLSGALGIATHSIKTFTSELLELSGITGPLGTAFAVMGGIIVTTIATITTAIISLGNRGSDVSDVANTFEHFSGSVDVAAESLRQMQEGTKGTVTNFDLMKSASKLLAADVKLTSDQFGTLSKSAFVLQNQGLGPTKDMLELVSQALLTGRKRTLEMKIGKIDLTAAEQAYRKTLSDQTRTLTEMEKAEISRVSIIDALNRKVKEAGDQQRDFGETMDAAVIAIKNWGDELSQRVADSPRVMAAVHAIEDAVKKAFGDDSRSLMDRFVGAIENIADTVARDGPKFIEFWSGVVDKVKEAYAWLEKYDKLLRFINPTTTGSVIGPAISDQLDALAAAKAAAGGIGGVDTSEFGLGFDDGSGPAKPQKPMVPPKPTVLDPDKIKKSTLSLQEWAKGLRDAEASQWKLALSTRKMTLEISDTIKARRQELEIYPPLIESYSYLTEELVDQRTGTERLNDSLLEQADILGKRLTKEQEKTHKMIEMATTALAKQRSAWDTTYSALGHVATILDNVSGKFAEVGVVAARTGQAMMEAFAKQDYIGVAVAGVTGLVTIWKKLTGPTEYELRVREAAKEMKTLTAEAVKAAGSMQRLALNASMVGINIKGAFDSKDPKFLAQILDEMQQKTDLLNSSMEEYGFTWKDMSEQYRTAALADQFADLVEKADLLTHAGIEYDEVLKRQAKSYDSLIQAAIKSGTKIPAAMRPAIEQLIRMGKISKQTADLMMGIGDSGIPALEDIKAAAERYGITLDQLGGKVKQLEITDLAAQYVADWDILSAATDDWALLIDKMGPKVQSLVLDAMKYGSELPSSMKPMIQAFIDAHKLVDANGVALTDLSQLNWATPIEEMFETLIGKLDEFIDKLLTLDGMNISPNITPNYGSSSPNIEDPAYMATGGTVVPFRPRGSDTVPAMLTPGERVIPRGSGGGTAIFEVNGRKMAEIVVPEIPGAVKRLGIR